MDGKVQAEAENFSSALQATFDSERRIIRPKLGGTVTPPADMMTAARNSLSDQAFEDLMEQTDGRAPTPDELCKMVEAYRQART